MIVLRKWFGSKESAAEKQLLHRYRGDRARLERMIQLELMHRPGMSRAAGARAALDRWLQDERPERWARGSSAHLVWDVRS